MLPQSDLWVVPPPPHSAWFARLDWYLNWQMSKGLAHRPAKLSSAIERLAAEYEIVIPSIPIADPASLLIACKGLVPAEKCIVLPFNGDLTEWLAQISNLTRDLVALSVSIFLPANISLEGAQKIWSTRESAHDVRFIADHEESK